MTKELFLIICYGVVVTCLIADNIIEVHKRKKSERYLQTCRDFIKWNTARKSNWVLDPDADIIVVDERKCYYELDGIRLIIEDGCLVGWYRPGEAS